MDVGLAYLQRVEETQIPFFHATGNVLADRSSEFRPRRIALGILTNYLHIEIPAFIPPMKRKEFLQCCLKKVQAGTNGMGSESLDYNGTRDVSCDVSRDQSCYM